mgnify:CR=1 FL=1
MEDYGYFSSYGTIWSTCGDDDSIRIFYLEAEQIIQETLMQELDQDFKRLEGIIVKLIDQQKKVQLEQQRLNGVFRAMVEIIARLSGNGLKDKFMRMMEKNE